MEAPAIQTQMMENAGWKQQRRYDPTMYKHPQAPEGYFIKYNYRFQRPWQLGNSAMVVTDYPDASFCSEYALYDAFSMDSGIVPDRRD